MSKEEAISSEELEEVVEETDESDRRAFLKTAAKAAGAMALFSVAGSLVDDEAVAQEEDEGEDDVATRPNPVLRNMRMDIANKSSSRQLSFSGKGLGEALQAQGFIPSSVKNLNNVSIIIYLKW